MRIITVAALSAVFGFLAGCCFDLGRLLLHSGPVESSSPATERASGGKAPDSLRIDLGVIHTGRKVYHAFWMNNPNVAPAEVAAYETSCDCLTIHLPKEPIKPNGRGLVILCFDAAHEPNFAGSLMIDFRLLDSSKTTIQEGKVMVDVLKAVEGI